MQKNGLLEQLNTHYATLRTHELKDFFQDPNRAHLFSADVAGLFVDYSKQWLTAETLTLLNAYALEKNVPAAITALFAGEKINLSENRAAMHWALRAPMNENDTTTQATLSKMALLASQFAQKKLLGYTGKPIDTILHLGVGGSGLGPKLYYDAFGNTQKHGTCHFIIDFDDTHLHQILNACDPEKTLAIVVSKSFTTPETMQFYHTIRTWFSDARAIEKQCYAVTANAARATAQGFLSDHILPFEETIGGRYSVWSAVNLANVLVFGSKHFNAFLAGAHEMDLHFQHTPLTENLPVILGLLAFWYNNFFHAYSAAVVPYHPFLAALPAYLQQLYMESLGKRVDLQGKPIHTPTGQVIWGEVGPASQHSFHQLLMQGTQMIPVEFILPFYHPTLSDYDKKRAAYCLSQSETLLNGCEGSAYQRIEGNRPSTTIVIRDFSPKTLGALLALHEHRVFVQSVLWNINAFDQWGVERGKQVANQLLHDGITAQTDGSTKQLFNKIYTAL